MAEYYTWLKALHLIAVISWMAAMLYLPRIYVYHCKVIYGSEADILFQTMEKKLLRVIMNPSMIITIILGLILTYIYGLENLTGWFHLKMTLVIFMTAIHGVMAKWRIDFSLGKNKHSERFYRIVNELPAVLIIIITILVIVKPF